MYSKKFLGISQGTYELSNGYLPTELKSCVAPRRVRLAIAKAIGQQLSSPLPWWEAPPPVIAPSMWGCFVWGCIVTLRTIEERDYSVGPVMPEGLGPK